MIFIFRAIVSCSNSVSDLSSTQLALCCGAALPGSPPLRSPVLCSCAHSLPPSPLTPSLSPLLHCPVHSLWLLCLCTRLCVWLPECVSACG